MTPAAALARSLATHELRHVLALAPVVLGDELAGERGAALIPNTGVGEADGSTLAARTVRPLCGMLQGRPPAASKGNERGNSPAGRRPPVLAGKTVFIVAEP